MNRFKVILAVFSLLTMSISVINAQDDAVKFSAMGRGINEYNWRAAVDSAFTDSLNPNRANSGGIQIDLGISLNPNKNTEIQTILRFKTIMGGFYGGGASAELRHINAKGRFFNVINYEIGDLQMELSPYTLFNPGHDAAVNEASIFGYLRRDITDFENFVVDNRWWQQGVHSDFALKFKDMPIEIAKFDLFMLRNKSGGGGVDNRFHGGGKLTIQQSEHLDIGINSINLFDAVNSHDEKIYNNVMSLELDYNKKLGDNLFTFNAESGFSILELRTDTTPGSGPGVIMKDTSKTGSFMEIRTGMDFVKDFGTVSVEVGWKYVDDQFYSAGAQTKRIDYMSSATMFEKQANMLRPINSYDLTRDPNIYNRLVDYQLKAYNPCYGNAMPYGAATPNRQGLIIDLGYKNKAKSIVANVEANLLQDVAGFGSTELRSFMVVKPELDIQVNKLLDIKRKILLSYGTLYETTTRDDSVGVNLTNTIIDLGLEIETFRNLDLIGGIKMITSVGKEFLYTYDQYNDIGLPSLFDIDVNESLMAVGLRYNFTGRTYFSVQYHTFTMDDNKNDFNNYTYDQVMIIFNLKL